MQENYIDTIVSLVLMNHFSPEWESWQKKSAHARGEKGLRDIMCSISVSMGTVLVKYMSDCLFR